MALSLYTTDKLYIKKLPIDRHGYLKGSGQYRGGENNLFIVYNNKDGWEYGEWYEMRGSDLEAVKIKAVLMFPKAAWPKGTFLKLNKNVFEQLEKAKSNAEFFPPGSAEQRHAANRVIALEKFRQELWNAEAGIPRRDR